MRTEMSTKANGGKTKPTVMEYILELMALVIQDSGSTIFNMDTASRNGTTDLLIKESTIRA